MSHTQGKLSVDAHKNIVAEGGGLVAFPGIAAGFDQEANARRLVACWNACEGISTEELESERSSSTGWARTASKLLKATTERDALRAVNAELVDALNSYDGSRAIDQWDESYPASKAWESKRFAALAKAKELEKSNG